MKRLLAPRHIVFIGGRTCVPAIEMARSVGFAGDIWVVHPKYETLAGRPVYPSIDALPHAPDAAFLNVSKNNVFDLVEQLSNRGAGGAVCFAAGFAELGDDGRRQQAELAARAGELALIGPNSAGFLNYFDGVALWPVADHESYRLEKGVAILSSSGGVLFNYSVNQRSLESGIMIGVGNQAALDYSDYLHVLAEDPRVSAVGLVVEDLVDAVSFSRAAAEALAADKPVVVLKAGASDIGARVAATHSGALVADDEMVQALLDRVGAIRVASLPELDETLKMLTTTRRPQGRRVAVLTNSGGEKALAADAAAGTVLEFAPPSPEVAEDLSAQIPEFAVVTNPFDYNAYFPGAGPDVLAEDNPHLLTKCFRTMIDDGYHVAMMLAGFRTYPDGTVAARDSTLRSWADAVRGTGVSAVMASALPEHMPPVRGRELIENGIAPLQGLREAMLAVHHAIVWEERRRKYAGGHLNTPVNSGAAARGLADLPALAAGRRLVNEADSKTALAAHGLVIPKGRRVAPEEATGASAAIGYPVAIKALEPVIAHKAKAGAVVLNVTDAAQVADAVGSIHTALAAHGTQLVEVLVERMVEEAAHELIAGIKHDPRFGHALVFGRGGSAVEFIEDVEIILLPASEADIQNLVETSSVAAELSEHAIAAVVRALVAVASFVDDRRDEVSALDVNPLIVTAADEVVAVDALLELTDGEESAR